MARYFHQLLESSNCETPLADNQRILLTRLFQAAIDVFDEGASDTVADIIRDVAVALTGKEIEFGEKANPQCPNGIKMGMGGLSAAQEDKMYDNLPSLVTFEEYEQGEIPEYGSYYPS